jgi:hypothetical protein
MYKTTLHALLSLDAKKFCIGPGNKILKIQMEQDGEYHHIEGSS